MKKLILAAILLVGCSSPDVPTVPQAPRSGSPATVGSCWTNTQFLERWQKPWIMRVSELGVRADRYDIWQEAGRIERDRGVWSEGLLWADHVDYHRYYKSISCPQ